MDAQGRHCPFLNRSDPRCSENLSLDDLRHAFSHCFGQYRSCPLYAALLVERQARQRHAVPAKGKLSYVRAAPIPVTVHRRLAKPVPAAEAVPAVSGV